jgi:hypothetical protein
MAKHLKPNWHAINKAINGTPESRHELLRELSSLQTKVKNKINLLLTQQREKRQREKVSCLRSLPISAAIYYTGFYEDAIDIIFKSGEKVQDGRKYMKVRIGSKLYNLSYDWIQDTPLTQQQVEHIKTNASLRGILSKIKDRINPLFVRS